MASPNTGVVHLAPSYLESFTCLKGDCPDTCCAGWGIPVDRTSYRKLQTAAATEKGAFIRDALTLYQPQDDSRWALVQTGPDNRCCFLEGSGLCRLYREMGQDFLPEVCASYPRIAKDLGPVVEYSLAPSCPAVAALALPAREGLELVQLPAGRWPRTSFNHRLDLAALPEEDWRGRFFFPAKQEALAILGERRLTIEDRLLMLGLYLQDVEAAGSGAPEAPPPADVLAAWRERRRCAPDFPVGLGGITPLWQQQLGLTVELLKARLTTSASGPAFAGLAELSLGGKLASGVQAYREGLALFGQAMAGRRHLLENYLTLDLFQSKLFLTGRVLDEYVAVVVSFSLTRFLLAGLALAGGEWSDAAVIRVIQLVCREMEHNQTYRKLVVDFFSRPGYPTLAGLTMLLKI